MRVLYWLRLAWGLAAAAILLVAMVSESTKPGTSASDQVAIWLLAGGLVALAWHSWVQR